jgi:hypothetical protein
MIHYCATCKEETEFDEAFEDRFNPFSAYGHYQVSAGLVCLKCGTEYDPEEEENYEPEEDTIHG